MRLVIYRPAKDGLSRERWTFWPTEDHSGFALVLEHYSIERRKSARGRWAGAVPEDRWSVSDERHYTSGLSRPKDIPRDVLTEAWAAIPRTNYIGWRTAEHRFSEPPAE